MRHGAGMGAGEAPEERARPRFDVASVLRSALDGRAAGAPIPTGFPTLDGLLGGGLRRGDLVVLAGDTGSGKSALALAIALNVCAAGGSAAFLSGEMTAARILERALAMRGRVAIDDLRRGSLTDEAHAAAAAAALALRERAPVLEDLRDAGLTGVSDLLAVHLGIEVTVVDPLQALALGRLPLDEEVAHAAHALKELSIRRSTAALVVSQLAPSTSAPLSSRPQLHQLGALGALQQHADVVLGLFREEMYGSHPDTEGAAELHVLKNRNGPGGMVDLYFHREWLRFEEVA
ncbi:MAG TPA: DnaB-like helicase C-terminal domain-containing protein [Gemmatimonadaceae bacterium]|nr:DnaB-like helicase C-terminal domain-containing protein [Gemmatimonadaceae bacterium]